MKLPTETFGNVVVVHTPEELSVENSDPVHGFLTSLDRQFVIIDIDGTETFDSVGLTTLLDVQDVLRESEGDVKICTNNAVNRKILEVTRIDQHLEVFESVIDAVKSFAT